jgi:type II secretory pathway pseudopilin PulG
MLIAVAILALIAAIATPSLLRAKQDSWEKRVEGTRKTLNDAIVRAILKHKTSDGVNLSTLPPELQSEDPEVVITYLVVNGYIQ